MARKSHVGTTGSLLKLLWIGTCLIRLRRRLSIVPLLITSWEKDLLVSEILQNLFIYFILLASPADNTLQ